MLSIVYLLHIKGVCMNIKYREQSLHKAYLNEVTRMQIIRRSQRESPARFDKKKFYITELSYGIVEVDIPDNADEEEIDFIVRDAIQLGETWWYDVEVTDITEAK
jgi:hypothetical protein